MRVIDGKQAQLAALAAYEDRRRLRAHRVPGRRGTRKPVRVLGVQFVLDVGHPDDLFAAVTLEDHSATFVGISLARMGMHGGEAAPVERERRDSDRSLLLPP